MTAPPNSFRTQAPQLAMANPPRKAKRLRELALREYSGEPSMPPSIVHPPSPALRASTPPPAAPPRRRGRKPAGPLSKTAREQLRKTNHSVIEKRRREKINEALAALRELVPNDKPEGDKKKEDKEFKLEILVRTVEYLRMMVDRVKKLEVGKCQKCAGLLSVTIPPSSLPKAPDIATGGKRKRLDYEDEDAGDDIDSEDEDFGGVFFTPAPVHGQAVTSALPENPSCSHPLPRLPSISSWMPNSFIENPNLDPHAFQLPSPPRTAPFVPTNASTASLPGLVLPSPIGPGFPSVPGTGHQARVDSPSTAVASPLFDSRGSRDRDVPDLPLDAVPQQPRRHNKSIHARPLSAVSQGSSTSNPVPADSRIFVPGGGGNGPLGASSVSPWTRDDQTAASLLLNISSHRSSTAQIEPQERDSGRGGRARGVVLAAQTPSSMLGMMEGETSRAL